MNIITQSCRMPTPDERMSAWAASWYARGYHHNPPCASLSRSLATPLARGRYDAAPDRVQVSGNFSTLAEWEAYERGDAQMPTLPPF